MKEKALALHCWRFLFSVSGFPREPGQTVTTTVRISRYYPKETRGNEHFIKQARTIEIEGDGVQKLRRELKEGEAWLDGLREMILSIT